MCGIVGLVSNISEEKIREKILIMRDLIAHRGPDDMGYFQNSNVALGHRRLSIIDITTGQQPMHDASGRFCIVFNGEIYNFKSLRRDLEDKGYRFTTHSDTEVILNAYIEYRSDCVKHLNGIFAFAIWDSNEKLLYIARDHMGVKPLYYYHDDNNLVFSSEIKSIFAADIIKPQCNVDAIAEYFLFRSVAGERTLFKNIKSLMPGQYMIYKDQELVINDYWSPLSAISQIRLSYDDACIELERLLLDSISMQMVSDVPLGTFCSGGIDSSLVTAIAATQKGGQINTYSVGFDESDFDESTYARMVSKKYDTNHHELRLNNQQFADLLPAMIWHNDEPLNFANSVHIYALSKLAKEKVTVVLTGEGADELFGGYPRYHIARYLNRLSSLPPSIRRYTANLLRKSGGRKAKKLAAFLAYNANDAYIFNSAVLSENMNSMLLSESVPEEFSYRQDIAKKACKFNDPLMRATLQDQYTYLVSILNRQDKMSMAASIESRVPLLDYRLVEYANSLPSAYKQKGVQTKRVLKKVAEKYLPMDVIYRRKSGFGVPLGQWFRDSGGLGALVSELFTEKDIPEYLSKPGIDKLLKEHIEHKKDNSEMLWTILNFLIWKKKYNIDF